MLEIFKLGNLEKNPISQDRAKFRTFCEKYWKAEKLSFIFPSVFFFSQKKKKKKTKQKSVLRKKVYFCHFIDLFATIISYFCGSQMMLYYIKQPNTPSFTFGLVKTDTELLIRSVETILKRSMQC